jgi:putative ABC transport system permease protein
VNPARCADLPRALPLTRSGPGTTRTGTIVGPRLAERFGWKVGDKIPLKSQIWPLKDGSRAWEFDLVGIFGDKVKDSCARVGNMYINYAYFDEARSFGQGGAGIIVVRIQNPDDAGTIGNTIDAMFENSPDETKTQTEKDFAELRAPDRQPQADLYWILARCSSPYLR